MLSYQYSFHQSREAAADALESYFAEGIVSLGEGPRIERKTDHRGRVIGYAVMFREG